MGVVDDQRLKVYFVRAEREGFVDDRREIAEGRGYGLSTRPEEPLMELVFSARGELLTKLPLGDVDVQAARGLAQRTFVVVGPDELAWLARPETPDGRTTVQRFSKSAAAAGVDDDDRPPVRGIPVDPKSVTAGFTVGMTVPVNLPYGPAILAGFSVQTTERRYYLEARLDFLVPPFGAGWGGGLLRFGAGAMIGQSTTLRPYVGTMLGSGLLSVRGSADIGGALEVNGGAVYTPNEDNRIDFRLGLAVNTIQGEPDELGESMDVSLIRPAFTVGFGW